MTTTDVLITEPRRVRLLRGVQHNPQLTIGLTLLGTLALAALLAPLLSRYGPTAPDYEAINSLPSASHLLGTDYLGRDTLARILYGGRPDLAIAAVTVVASALLGTALGILGGYKRGLYDLVIMRIMDGLLAVPGLVLALCVAFVLGPSVFSLSLALIIVRIPYFARLARAETVSLMERPFIQLSIVAGCPARRIWIRHLIPNMNTTLLTQCAVTGGQAIFTSASLSFLGLGIAPPSPSWGGMLREGVPFLEQFPLQSLIPGVVIFLAMFSFNLTADGIRNAVS